MEIDFLGFVSDIFNGLMGFLGASFDTRFFLPVLIFLLPALFMNPKGPSKVSELGWSIFLGLLAAIMLVFFFRGTAADAALLALIVLVVGLCWMIAVSAGFVKKAILALSALFVVSVIVIVAVYAPPGPLLPGVILAIRDALQGAGNAIPNNN